VKKLIDFLSSLHFSIWLLTFLIGWFVWAIVLTASGYFETFQQMNNHLMPDWLSISRGKSPLIRFWFFGLCAIATALGINLIFCSWNKFLRMTARRMNRPAMLMLAIHIVFGLVILGHFGSLMIGFRNANVRLQEGESFELKNGYRVRADAIHFVNDVSVLTKPIKAMTSDEFSFESNFVEVSLYKNDLFLKSGRLSFLKPLVLDGIQFTLKNFTPPVSGGKTGANSSSAGTILFVSRNPAKNLVLTLFPLMIIGITVYLVMTWKQPGYQQYSSRPSGGGTK